mgnify:CR=1 FL=1
MSQFDFPRINFHGSVLLDVPTGNNGKFSPLKIYNQDAALPYTPPRVYLIPELVPKIQGLGYTVQTDTDSPYKKYSQYVEIASVTKDVYDDWAVQHLGTSTYDNHYVDLYKNVPLDGDEPQPSLFDGLVQPSYWNYYGDLSVYAEDIRITGIQTADAQGEVTTYTPGNSDGCPAGLAQLLGQSFSFHQQFFDPNSRTTAMFCDVDSIEDTCTQMFYTQAGIYGKPGGQEKTFFTGAACKSAFTWLSMSKVLNYNDKKDLLSPMSGATYFESTITLNQIGIDSSFQKDLNVQAGFQVDKLSMKILLHQVYEVRNPDYKKMPRKPIGNNKTDIPKNPARVAFSGSLCPFVEATDMTTHNVARILKNQIINNPKIDTTKFSTPIPKPKDPSDTGVPVEVYDQVQLSPAFVRVNAPRKIISLDIISTICEYGVGFGDYSCYGGPTSIPPFLSWENYDFGTLSLYFMPDGGGPGTLIGSITHDTDYNMKEFIARGGVMDFVLPESIDDVMSGRFAIFRNGTEELLVEDDYLIMSDQQGSYAEQGQDSSEGYKFDGPDRGPIILRCFQRGEPMQGSRPGKVRNTSTNVTEDFVFYDGVKFDYHTKDVGCVQYVFGITPQQYATPTSKAEVFYLLANGYTVTTRVLAADLNLLPYLDGTEPLTFDVLYNTIFSNYNNVLPIMNTILKFDENTWSEPYTMRRLKEFTDPKNWGHYMYMPVTRELSKNQQALLQKWANDILNSPS